MCLMFVFQWNNMGELILVMEGIPSCFVDNFYIECESQLLVMISVIASRERKDEVKEELYETS